MKYFHSLLIVAFISSCATSYQSQGWDGGYVDTQLSETLWKVSVNGNGYTSSSIVGDYALLRASELTLEKGYKYFVIASDKQNQKSSMAKVGGNSARTYGNINSNGNFNATTNYSTPTYIPVNKYENTLVYEMLSEKVDGVFVYDAQLIYDSLSAKYIK
jgi:hypothetical protein